MSASLTMRLVPPRTVPKALSLSSARFYLAGDCRAVGSSLGELIGWRNVFNAAAVMGVLCIFWIIEIIAFTARRTLASETKYFPLIATSGCDGRDDRHLHVFRRAVCFLHVYSPGVYEPGIRVDGLTLVLLVGIASFIGTSLSSFILKCLVKLALAGALLIVAVSALVLTLWGSDEVVATGAAIMWGLTFALVPVGWSTSITRSLANQQRKPGLFRWRLFSLLIPVGAAIGGYALDNIGLTSPLMFFCTLMLPTALLVTAKVNCRNPDIR
ncbi:hypothetical protein ACNKHU_23410 [Shigella flexneri]